MRRWSNLEGVTTGMAQSVRWDNRSVKRIAPPKILAAVGVVAPIMFCSVFTIAGLMRPGYDPLRQYVSELALGPNGWLQTANFLVMGLLLIAFAAGLHHGIPDGPRVSPALLVVAGVGFLLSGVFARDLPGSTPTLSGDVHKYASYILLALPLASLSIAPHLKQDPCWRVLAPYSVAAGLLTLLLLPGYFWGIQAASLQPWMGLYQRILIAIPMSWLEVMAVRLLLVASRSDGTSASGSPPTATGRAHNGERLYDG